MTTNKRRGAINFQPREVVEKHGISYQQERLVMCAMAVAALLSAGGGGVAGRVVEEGCPEIEYAYPFQSTCQYPAENSLSLGGAILQRGGGKRGPHAVACDVPLPCPTTQGARCLSYYLDLDDYGTRVFAVHSDGITYAAVHGTDFVGVVPLPFLLRRVSSNYELTQVPGTYLLA
ncbi:hypothetical protein GOP47_0005257 [Adiantum capillus-veneris]|uniref:Uncharacterized protein n=1 Tax=Adiantum capillus-veneris TaxID=13818 RepID=A0A9D4ZL76_ADICA|nr:hypothetical protein GOP47_0005257 [Adiantum capillus-veneris]